MTRVSSLGLLLAAALLGACARGAAPLAGAPGVSSGAGNASGSEAPPPPGADGSGAKDAPQATLPALPLPGGEQPTPDKALPELKVEPLGMHVGGGKNDAEEKAPFHRALEQRFPAFLECYRLVEDPFAGGSFGVDLKIPRAGGAPIVEQPRTRIKGAAFRDCMVAAIGKAQFDKPKAGPTVISYSVRFSLGAGKR